MRARPKGAKFRNLTDAEPHLTEPDLDEIEELARANESETYRGPLLALVDEVRRLRGVALGREVTSDRWQASGETETQRAVDGDE